MLGCMTTTISLPRTGRRSAQLIAASERMTLDPFTEVDWETPIDDRAFHLPPEWLPLYGTALWEAMTPEARITYSRHECAALCGAGIWFENQLMQLVLRHLAELPVDNPAHRYLLVEVADECRHSIMFGEYIRRAGTPAYGPRADAGALDALDALGDVPGKRALGYVLILAVEELLDAINRATSKDDRIHPVSRSIAKLHVAEEARHVSFAKTYLAEVWPSLDEEERRAVRSIAPTAVAIVADLTIDPAVYETLGIVGGEADARANPHHRARVVEGLTKLTSFLQELNVIDDAATPTWRQFGLIA
jgi:ribosomal protein S18 acetylase RimI-like enzyme